MIYGCSRGAAESGLCKVHDAYYRGACELCGKTLKTEVSHERGYCSDCSGRLGKRRRAAIEDHRRSELRALAAAVGRR